MSASKFSSSTPYRITNITYVRCSYQWLMPNVFLCGSISEVNIFSPVFHLKAPEIFNEDLDIKMRVIYNKKELVFSYESCYYSTLLKRIWDIEGTSIFSLKRSYGVLFSEYGVVQLKQEVIQFLPTAECNRISIPNTELKKYSRNDTDTILGYIKRNEMLFAELELVVPLKILSGDMEIVNPPKPMLRKNPTGLVDLYQNGELTDVTIVVQGTSFKTHKLILSAYSPVFKALFSHDMKESITSKVEITDFAPETFKILIDSMYKQGELNIGGLNLAMELYAAADKYDISYLKEASSDYMLGNVNIENALNILELVEKYDNDLKKAIQSFVVFNFGCLSNDMKSEIVRDRPHLLENILMFKYTK